MFRNEFTEADTVLELILFLLGITTLRDQRFTMIGEGSSFIHGERSVTARRGGTLTGSQRVAKQELLIAVLTHQ